MKTFDFIQTTVSHNIKDPHSKALEPDCLFPLARHCDTVSQGKGSCLWADFLQVICQEER